MHFQFTYLSIVLASTDCSAIERKGETSLINAYLS